VPVAEVTRFEQQFSAILESKGFAREAKLLTTFQRFYWAVLRENRLYIRGTLVCSDRLADDGMILLEPTCPMIEVTFPAGSPQQVEFLID
jgi:hypothetical protein